MSEEKELARAWGWFFIGLPAVIGWLAYGLAWLIQPRMGMDFPLPLEVAGYIVGAYYTIVGWLFLMGGR